MIKAIFIHTGYVEEAKIGHIMFTPTEGTEDFEDPVAAIKSLATELFETWYEDNKTTHYPKCCKKQYYDKEKYCSKCGNVLRISKNDTPSEDEVGTFIEFMDGLSGATVNGTSTETASWTNFCNLGSLLPLLKEEIIEVYQAEELFGAIVHPTFQARFCEKYNNFRLWEHPLPASFDELIKERCRL